MSAYSMWLMFHFTPFFRRTESDSTDSATNVFG